MIHPTNLMPHKPVKDPARFPWHEVSKVQHYWLDVNTMTRPIQAREDEGACGESKRENN